VHTDEFSLLFLSIGLLLAVAKLLGEFARGLRQPMVVGEILTGVLLGPSILGAIAPSFVAQVFPPEGPVALVREGLATISAALFLFVAGLEVDLRAVWRQGRPAALVALAGMVVPFLLGVSVAWWGPRFVGYSGDGPIGAFVLFVGTALAISALPVIARTLLDLNLLRSDFGMLLLSAATAQDLAGWMVFATILNWIGEGTHEVGATAALIIGFVLLVLVLIRPGIHKLLPWLHARASWPGGVVAFILCLALLGAAFTEWAGVHAIFGAFVVGVAVGDSRHLHERTRFVVGNFVSAIFAPLFFANIGLRIDFIENFDLGLVLLLLVLASVGKIAGCVIGARLGKMAPREGWALGFGMNARGAMEIILGLLALEAGLIDQRLFVALVVMALITSVASGPLMKWVLKLRARRRLTHYLAPAAFIQPLPSSERRDAIQRLSRALAPVVGVDAAVLDGATWAREQLMSTALGQRIAAPHARLEKVTRPAVAVGLSEHGVAWDAPDGEPVQVVFLVVTSKYDDSAQLEILADIAGLFGDGRLVGSAVGTHSFTELLAVLRTAGDEHVTTPERLSI
jgi:Kef-type K+ transport system membrane component KefB/mannitol/fructose-specific phosphotransferase system IIA component